MDTTTSTNFPADCACGIYSRQLHTAHANGCSFAAVGAHIVLLEASGDNMVMTYTFNDRTRTIPDVLTPIQARAALNTLMDIGATSISLRRVDVF